MAGVLVQPVGPQQLDDLRRLFEGGRTTRHCWCMAFCTKGWQFASGWYGGGNRRRFESMAVSSPAPMGVLASVGETPVGWCACGPRARYTSAIAGRSSLLTDRPRVEDDTVWLVACLLSTPTTAVRASPCRCFEQQLCSLATRALRLSRHGLWPPAYDVVTITSAGRECSRDLGFAASTGRTPSEPSCD